MKHTIGPFFAELESLGFQEKLASLQALATKARGNPVGALTELLGKPKLPDEALKRVQSLDLAKNYPALAGAKKLLPEKGPVSRLTKMRLTAWLAKNSPNPRFQQQARDALDKAMKLKLP